MSRSRDMDNQEVRDHKELVARLRAGEANIIRKIEFDPPSIYSRNTHPEVNYAGGISEEHYGREARSYGPGQMQYYPESNGPKANQWGEGNPTGESTTWKDIYPIVGKENEGRYEKPPDYGRWRRDISPEVERSKKELLLCLAELLDMDEYPSRKERKEQAMSMLRMAKEEARRTGKPWEFGLGGNSEDEARDFAETYAGIIMDEEPPRETCLFPGVVPKEGVATRANMRRMERCLKEAYAAHMEQFKTIASWTEKENELLRWHRKIQQAGKSGKKENDTGRPRGEAYTRDFRRGLWSTESRGEGDKPPCKDNPQETKGTQRRVKGGEEGGQQVEKTRIGTHQEGQLRGEREPQESRRTEQRKESNQVWGHEHMRPGITNFPAPFNPRMGEEDEDEEDEIPTLEAAGGAAQDRDSSADEEEEEQEKRENGTKGTNMHNNIPEGTRIMKDVHLWEEESAQGEKPKQKTSQSYKDKGYVALPQGLAIAPADMDRNKPNATEKYPVEYIGKPTGLGKTKKQEKTQGGGKAARATEPPGEEETNQGRKRETKKDEPHAQGKGQEEEYTKGEEETRRDKESLERLKRQMERFENRAMDEWMEELIRIMKEESRRRKEESRKEEGTHGGQEGTPKACSETSEERGQPRGSTSHYKRDKQDDKQSRQDRNGGQRAADRNNRNGVQGAARKEDRRKPPQGAIKKRGDMANGAGKSQKEEDSRIRGKGTPGISRNGKCMACGEEPHSRNSQGRKRNRLQDRERACKAWNRDCNRCGSRGHLEKQCRTSLRLEEEVKAAKKESPQGEGEDEYKEERREEKRRWQNPGDYQDQEGEWERQYGGEDEPRHTQAEGEAEAAGASTSTLACQCVRNTAKECVYGIAPQCAPEEWAERNRRERGMPPMIRLPEDTEEEAKGLEEPHKKEKKKKKKWSIRVLRGKEQVKEEERGSQVDPQEAKGRLPLSILKRTGAEGRTVYGEDNYSQEEREKEEERCRECQSYYTGMEEEKEKTGDHEEVSDVENESGYESYYACKEADEEFFRKQEESRSKEMEQGNGKGGETEQSPPPAVKEGGQ